MTAQKVSSRIKSLETLACDAGWRNYHFVKVVTEDGVTGWSEFDEGFGAPGVATAINRLGARVIGQPVGDHERIYAELYALTRPAAGGVVALAMAGIENALLDAKAKSLGVPCYQLLGGKIRDRIRSSTGRTARPGASITPRSTSPPSPTSTALSLWVARRARPHRVSRTYAGGL